MKKLNKKFIIIFCVSTFIILIVLIAVFFHYFVGKTPAIFKNMDYQKEMILESYFMDKKNICNLLSNDELILLSSNQLRHREIYLVVRCENLGKEMAWGNIQCVFNGRILKKIFIRQYGYYIFPVTNIVHLDKSDKVPEIDTKWINLYTKY